MTVEITIVVLAAITMALTEVVKKIGGDGLHKFLPLIALGIGLVFSFLFLFNVTLLQTVLVGLIIGLSATGFYENTLEKITTKAKG